MSVSEELFESLHAGDRNALAKAITLVESKKPADHAHRLDLLQRCANTRAQTLRIAITGAPGVGKSSLIERLGLEYVKRGNRVAVLAIDPSSRRTGGSILGDKTRMPGLARSESAFIRASPTSGFLGGLAEMTRESILLFEAAGYDRVLIETVGVGQSETAAYDHSDLVLYVGISGAGDSLQGIKRGILEIVDLVAINKTDGEAKIAATLYAKELSGALSLLHGKNGKVSVLNTSALEGLGILKVIFTAEALAEEKRKDGSFSDRRNLQLTAWFEDAFAYFLGQAIERDAELADLKKKLLQDLETCEVDPYTAAFKLITNLLSR